MQSCKKQVECRNLVVGVILRVFHICHNIFYVDFLFHHHQSAKVICVLCTLKEIMQKKTLAVMYLLRGYEKIYIYSFVVSLIF